VVLVTASVVEPSDTVGKTPLPGDAHAAPSDWELFMQGRLGAAPNAAQEVDSVDVKEPGLAELKGPGAWARYGPRS
jgi:hypothetical protein